MLPLASNPLSAGVHPRGIAAYPDNSGYVVATTTAAGVYPSAVQVYTDLGLSENIAGSNTQLDVPVGVALDSAKKIYVSNNAAPSLTVYVLPSPTVAPSTTPSPTPTPTVSPSGSPSPTPTPAANNIAPVTTIAGSNTQLVAPLGIALDSSGNLFVADAGSATIPVAPKILVFSAPLGAGTQNISPAHVITSQNPAFVNPTDVKVDASGKVYVIDAGLGPNANSKLLIFPASTYGVVTPSSVVALPQGSALGIALSP